MVEASLGISSDQSIYLSITFGETNHVKTDMEVVKSDRENLKMG